MTFTSIPQNFTPLSHGLVFAFRTDGEIADSVEVEILDADLDEIIATQHLHSVSEGSVNIAPYLPRRFERVPSQLCCSSFVGMPTARYAVRVNGVTSDSVVVAANREEIHPRSLVTQYPLSRCLSYGDHDEVMVVVEQGDELSAEIWVDNELYSTIESVAVSPMMLFVLASEEFDAAISNIDVVISCGGERLGELHYRVTPRRDGAVRLAWMSRSGAIERYTFPVALSLSSNADMVRVRGEDIYEIVSGSAEALLEVVSNYEPRAVITSLTEIISSTGVWMEYEDGAVRVDSITNSVRQSLYGEPGRVTLQLRLWREEVKVW